MREGPSPDPAVDEPPLKNWPPPEILRRWEERRAQYRRRRARRRRAALAVGLVALVGAAGWGLPRLVGGPVRASRSAGSRAGYETLAWAVTAGSHTYLAVLGAAPRKPPVAVVVPGDVLVDLPGAAPTTVETAASDPSLLLAAAQATLDRRVDHYLTTDSASLAALVDQVGPIEVDTEVRFQYGGQVLGPGEVAMSGPEALAYLATATDDDRTSRWEDVLGGLLAASPDPARWGGPLGTADSDQAARRVLLGAHGATVLELPTTSGEEGGLEVDDPAARRFLASTLGPGRPLVRVVVLVGNGRPQDARLLASLLAPAGFRVVASQAAPSQRVNETQVVAAGERLLGLAQQVRSILGVGSVYVGPQPTGIADITVVVGRDFQRG